MAVASLGAHTFGFVWDTPVEKAITELAEQGFNSVELLGSPPHLDVYAGIAEAAAPIRRALRATGGELLAIDLPSNDYNLASPCPEVTAFAVAAYSRAIEIAAECGGRWVGIISGRRHALLPPPDERLVEVFRGAIEQLIRHGEARGVRILLENHPQAMLTDAAAIERFIAPYERVDVLYDVSNGSAVGEEPAAALDRLWDRIGIVHLSDQPAGAWKHDPIGSGDIDFEPIRRAVEAQERAVPVVLEVISARPLGDLAAGRDRLLAAGWTVQPHARA